MIARIVFLQLIVLLATTLSAQQNEKQALSLAIDPPRITLKAGETQRFTAHIKGAPTESRILWAVLDSERDVSSISQDGVFTARIVRIYRVLAIATIDGTEVKAVAKATVLGQVENHVVPSLHPRRNRAVRLV
jgi:hypothetical protein